MKRLIEKGGTLRKGWKRVKMEREERREKRRGGEGEIAPISKRDFISRGSYYCRTKFIELECVTQNLISIVLRR